MISIKFDDTEILETFGCILASKSIGTPEVQTNQIEVPMRDGLIDATEALAGAPKYLNREISISLLYLGEDYERTFSRLMNFCHGRKKKIWFSDDPNFYYIGNINVSDGKKLRKDIARIEIAIDANPFKYDIVSSAVDWEWDTFDFEDGIINEAGALVVNGTTSFTLICRRMRQFPIFTASEAMTLEYDGKTYTLKKGEQKLYGLFLTEGENRLTFRGNGTVSIDYVGGEL